MTPSEQLRDYELGINNAISRNLNMYMYQNSMLYKTGYDYAVFVIFHCDPIDIDLELFRYSAGMADAAKGCVDVELYDNLPSYKVGVQDMQKLKRGTENGS
jgi:hypothetical protein